MAKKKKEITALKKIWVIIHEPKTYKWVPELVEEIEPVGIAALVNGIHFNTKDQAEQWIDKVKYVANGLRAGDAVLLKRIDPSKEEPVVKALSTLDPLPKPVKKPIKKVVPRRVVGRDKKPK